MAKIFLICGKICSGKTYYAKELKEKYNAVILSTDETTFDLTGNEQGDSYDSFAKKVNLYLMKKAAEIVKAGANVILDWGFWTRADRENISDYLKENDAGFEWHYMDISDEQWNRNIQSRNKKIMEGKDGSDFYVDEGLKEKVLSMFEIPSREEIDVWYDTSCTKKINSAR